MANHKKQSLGLKGSINLPKKMELVSKEIDEKDTDKIVNKIHNSSGKAVRLSIDCPEELYKSIKISQINKGFKTTKDYILSLIERDLSQ